MYRYPITVRLLFLIGLIFILCTSYFVFSEKKYHLDNYPFEHYLSNLKIKRGEQFLHIETPDAYINLVDYARQKERTPSTLRAKLKSYTPHLFFKEPLLTLLAAGYQDLHGLFVIDLNQQERQVVTSFRFFDPSVADIYLTFIFSNVEPDFISKMERLFLNNNLSLSYLLKNYKYTLKVKIIDHGFKEKYQKYLDLMPPTDEKYLWVEKYFSSPSDGFEYVG